jgi:hypothetical protein
VRDFSNDYARDSGWHGAQADRCTAHAARDEHAGEAVVP